MDHVTLGSRVYYKDNGPEDTGTIVDILLDDDPFVVKWDQQNESKFEQRNFSIEGLGGMSICVNPADENIDRFKGSQLALIPTVPKGD